MNPTEQNTRIIIATMRPIAPHVHVMRASLQAYTDVNVDIYESSDTFGRAYSNLHEDAITDGYKYVIHANDDIVLRPDTIEKLFEDAAHLNALNIKWGWLAARTDWVRHTAQNIRFPYDNKALGSIAYPEEQQIVQVASVSPIFALIRADHFMPYAPINWFSDDEQCHRMTQAGYRHFVSRAYVHHVGSQTMRPDTWAKEQGASIDYLRQHNPQFLEAYGIA